MIDMKYKITTQVTSEPITLSEARSHLRIEPFGYPLAHPDDSDITLIISSAREWCEQYIRRALATQTVTMSLSKFENAIELPLAPVQSVVSVKYYDTSNVLQTLDSSFYYVDYFDSVIYLEVNKTWPNTVTREIAVIIEYVAGYTKTVGTNLLPLPNPIKSAMFLLIGSLYENRQEDMLSTSRVSFNSLPMGVYNLLQSYRLGLGV
jgi:uncharacterized phiE125 gp8 family phage protein